MSTQTPTHGGAVVPSPSTPSARQVRRWLSVAFLVFLGLDAAFWFLADFGSFVPACDGPLVERALFTGLTACGPFAMVINGHFSNLVASRSGSSSASQSRGFESHDSSASPPNQPLQPTGRGAARFPPGASRAAAR